MIIIIDTIMIDINYSSDQLFDRKTLVKPSTDQPRLKSICE